MSVLKKKKKKSHVSWLNQNSIVIIPVPKMMGIGV